MENEGKVCFGSHVLSRGWGVLRWDVCLVVLPRDQEVGRARTHLERTKQPRLLERRLWGRERGTWWTISGIKCQSKGEGPGLEAWIREVQSMRKMRPAIHRGRQAQAGSGTRAQKTLPLPAKMPRAPQPTSKQP